MAASNVVRVEAASGRVQQRCAVTSSMTQGKRQDPSQSQGRVDGEVFGPALILGDGLPAGSEDDCADMVVLTVRGQDLTRIDDLIQESQKWDGAQLINRQIILHEGPWRDNNMAIAWELYFQA